MSYRGVLDVAIGLDSLAIIEERFRGNYRVAVSMYRKKQQSAFMDKVQGPVNVIAQPFKTGDRQAEERGGDENIYAPQDPSADIKIYKAYPYLLTDSWKPQESSCKVTQEVKIGKVGYFQIDFPVYPHPLPEPIHVQVDLLLQPDATVVISI